MAGNELERQATAGSVSDVEIDTHGKLVGQRRELLIRKP
ncbi:hypothetical protein ABI_23900 [Asticcacaulis biprosthecium C19]|uniref:Uncharacterized protein n=1 Tax=Asticcacaulis biprosthecium C19 TaxID=715226 RepID=F4QNR9_9CAUL|nr:hypothetical protein ABI_23900 [Asticcacaulis biprosthecium C19]